MIKDANERDGNVRSFSSRASESCLKEARGERKDYETLHIGEKRYRAAFRAIRSKCKSRADVAEGAD